MGQLAGSQNYLYNPRQLWTTNTVHVQFAPLPAPTVSSVENVCCNQQCAKDPVTGLMSNCTQGRTRITMKGHYLYPGLNITVGGVPAVQDISTGVTSASFILPLAAYDPQKRYDMVVTTVAGSLMWPGAFSFISSPLFAWVDPCADTGYVSFNGATLMQCLGGERITLHVANFDFASLVNISLQVESWPEDETLECSDVQWSADNPMIVTCILPQRLPTWYVNVPSSMIATFNSTTALQSNELVHLWVWDWPQSPRITSAVGCSTTLPATSLQLTQCLGGEMLTLTGTSFNASDENMTATFEWNAGLGAYQCSPLYVVNSTTVLCELPVIDDSFEYGVSYRVVLNAVFIDTNDNPNPTFSNGLYVTFLPELPPPDSPPASTADSSSSDSSHRTVVIAASVVSVSVVVLLCVSLAVWKRSALSELLSSSKRQQSASHSQSSAWTRQRDGESEMTSGRMRMRNM